MAMQQAQGIFEKLQQLRAVREFETAFREATGLSFRLKPLPEPADTPFIAPDDNPVCSLICSTATGRTLCHQLQRELRRRFEERPAPQQLQCLGGLTVVAVPVFVGGALVAVLHTNRLLVQAPQPAELARLAAQLEQWGRPTPTGELAEQFAGLAVISKPQLDAVTKLLQIFAEHLGDLAGRRLVAERAAGPSPLAAALAFMREHQTERLRLSRVAKQARLSSFYFCKLFRKTMGMTFTEYLLRQRVEKAKELLLSRQARVGDIAFQVGFGSIAHFNRAFKRCTGTTPTAYRNARLAASPNPSQPA